MVIAVTFVVVSQDENGKLHTATFTSQKKAKESAGGIRYTSHDLAGVFVHLVNVDFPEGLPVFTTVTHRFTSINRFLESDYSTE